jgi:hypothetical protein
VCECVSVWMCGCVNGGVSGYVDVLRRHYQRYWHHPPFSSCLYLLASFSSTYRINVRMNGQRMRLCNPYTLYVSSECLLSLPLQWHIPRDHGPCAAWLWGQCKWGTPLCHPKSWSRHCLLLLLSAAVVVVIGHMNSRGYAQVSARVHIMRVHIMRG